MNEKLRELMVKADYPAPELAKRAQALAELIVRECAGIAAGSDMPSKDIKEYFGVK